MSGVFRIYRPNPTQRGRLKSCSTAHRLNFGCADLTWSF